MRGEEANMFHSRQDFQTRPDFQKRATPLAWAAIRRLAAWPLRVAAARAAVRELAGMSDRELADIRLTRQDLRDATALALSDDPTRIFAMRVRERDQARLTLARAPE
jgi:uncharacterized protein YjiS (DUF1127 family)